MRGLSDQMNGLALNTMYMTVAGSHVINGYVCRAGECALEADVQLRTTFDDTRLAGREVALQLSAVDSRLEIDDVLLNVPLLNQSHASSTMHTVGWTRYRCGDRTGYGVAEFLERIDP